MQIKFSRDTFHPRRRSLTPEYKAGRTYDLPLEEANYFISKGVATPDDILTRIAELDSKARQKQRTLASLSKPTLSTLSMPTLAGKQPKDATTLTELLQALKVKPEPSKRLITPTLSDQQIESFKQYFALQTELTAKDLAEMILAIYSYAKHIKDNALLEKVSNDLLTLYRLTKHYDESHNDNGKK